MPSSFPLTGGGASAARSPRAFPTSPSLLARNLSRHLAAAVICFALVQIVVVYAAVAGGASAALGYGVLAMVVLVMLPLARRVERRWHDFADRALPCPRLTQLWARDVQMVWLTAMFAPPAWIGAALLVGQLA